MHTPGTGFGRTEPSIDSGVVDCLSSLSVFLVVNVESHAIGLQEVLQGSGVIQELPESP
jgi:hypothetical protein